MTIDDEGPRAELKPPRYVPGCRCGCSDGRRLAAPSDAFHVDPADQREIERLDRESGIGITLADLGLVPGRVVTVTPDGVTVEDPQV